MQNEWSNSTPAVNNKKVSKVVVIVVDAYADSMAELYDRVTNMVKAVENVGTIKSVDVKDARPSGGVTR